jgi:hypothetical protein
VRQVSSRRCSGRPLALFAAAVQAPCSYVTLCAPLVVCSVLDESTSGAMDACGHGLGAGLRMGTKRGKVSTGQGRISGAGGRLLLGVVALPPAPPPAMWRSVVPTTPRVRGTHCTFVCCLDQRCWQLVRAKQQC